jgi:hypothetical protein
MGALTDMPDAQSCIVAPPGLRQARRPFASGVHALPGRFLSRQWTHENVPSGEPARWHFFSDPGRGGWAPTQAARAFSAW